MAGCKRFVMRAVKNIGRVDNTDEQPSYYIKTLANSIWKLLFALACDSHREGSGGGGEGVFVCPYGAFDS